MEKIIVIGGGGHAKSVIAILRKIEFYEILGYIDVQDKGVILGVSYLGSDDQLEEIKKNLCCSLAVIGVGFVNISDYRKEIKERLISLGFDLPSIVSPTAIINEEVKIASGTVVMDGVIVNVYTTIGECSILNSGCIVDHDCVIGDYVHIAPGAQLSGGVCVGDFSLIAIGASVIQEVKIVNHCLIGAGAVVTECCEESGVYVGIPARKK